MRDAPPARFMLDLLASTGRFECLDIATTMARDWTFVVWSSCLPRVIMVCPDTYKVPLKCVFYTYLIATGNFFPYCFGIRTNLGRR